eukprot:c15426_g1_i2.p1 GENE.c15426_g1_i2~~c15426_g1_i2.p1  ORF type:complete len:102 (+),score=37.31 c15426_g1_i2:29-307(+)
MKHFSLLLVALFCLIVVSVFSQGHANFQGNEVPMEFVDEDWGPIAGDHGPSSFMQVETEVTGTETQELECNCEKMKCNCMKKCECAVPKKRS